MYSRLLQAYAEPQRHYHSVQHLRECLAQMDRIAALAERPAEVLMALWFHDAVYDTRAHDNEARSAAWACSALAEAGVERDAVTRVSALIMATEHRVQPRTPDAQVLVDVDLSILGAPPARFDDYERQVRQEYHWVPEPVFREKRRAVLRSFLDRRALYGTSVYTALFDAAARANLQRSLEALQG